MANEATVRTSLQIRKGNLEYSNRPTTFQADVSSATGPTPGGVTVSVEGTDISVAELTTPGLCWMMNLDGTNFVEFGIWDGVTFYPLGEMLPGEMALFRIARDLGKEFGTGTGTTGAAVNTLRLKADAAACECIVDIFEK